MSANTFTSLQPMLKQVFANSGKFKKLNKKMKEYTGCQKNQQKKS